MGHSDAGHFGELPRPRGRPEPVRLPGGADDGGAAPDGVVSRAPLRQAPGVQAFPEELSRDLRRRRHRHPPGGARGVGTPGGVQHGAAGDSRRRAARAEFQRRRRRPPAQQLPVRHDPPPVAGRNRNRRGGIVRGGYTGGEHEGRYPRFRRYDREMQLAVSSPYV